MNLEEKVLKVMQKGASSRFTTSLISMALKNSKTRKALIKSIEKATHKLSLQGSEDRPEKPTIIYKDKGYIKQIANTTINVNT